MQPRKKLQLLSAEQVKNLQLDIDNLIRKKEKIIEEKNNTALKEINEEIGEKLRQAYFRVRLYPLELFNGKLIVLEELFEEKLGVHIPHAEIVYDNLKDRVCVNYTTETSRECDSYSQGRVSYTPNVQPLIDYLKLFPHEISRDEYFMRHMHNRAIISFPVTSLDSVIQGLSQKRDLTTVEIDGIEKLTPLSPLSGHRIKC